MTSESPASSPSQIARRLLQQRKVPEALSLLNEIMQAKPEDVEGQELLGMALFMSRKFEDAKAAFVQLTRMAPMSATGWVNLGAVQNVLKEHQAATKSLRKAIQRDKKSASAYYNLGIAQRAMKMNSMAISAYREAIRIDPKMAEAYTNLGNLYVEMNNLSQAVRLLEDGVARCPGAKKIEAVLEKARMAKAGVSRTEAPLGRLVDEKELSRRQIRTAPRQLDAAARNHERETLHELGRTIRRSTKPIVELLTGPLTRQLHLLDLAVAQNDTRGEAPAGYDQMTQSLAEIDRLRGFTLEAVAEIRAELQKSSQSV